MLRPERPHPSFQFSTHLLDSDGVRNLKVRATVKYLGAVLNAKEDGMNQHDFKFDSVSKNSTLDGVQLQFRRHHFNF